MAEALMVVLDNSAFMINGDYEPTRWGAQIDATSVLLASRSNINVENAAGLATMAGPSVDVLCTPTTDNARVSACLSEAKVWGSIHFVEALKICALILKNRQNTNLRQRIFMFVGSAIQEQLEELRVIGRKLNKHQIAVSIAAFGDISAEQRAKLDGFIQTVSQEDNSTVTYIAAGLSVCDHLLDTPVFMGGIDSRFPPGIEAEDPELRMALEMSMKEEEERRKREAAAAVAVAKEAVPHSEKMEVEGPKDPPKPRRDEFDLTEQEALRLAMDLSKQEQMEIERPQDDDKKKKKDDADKETTASRGLEGSERQDLTQRPDFLTEKANTIKSQDPKFMNQLEELAQDSEQEQKDDQGKQSKDKNKKHQTEKHDKKDK